MGEKMGEQLVVESIEARRQTSASAVTAAVLRDRLQVRAALTQFRLDLATKAAALFADANAIKTTAKPGALVQPMFLTLQCAVTSMNDEPVDLTPTESMWC